MSRRLYNQRKAAGLCPLCGGTPTPGLITCEGCRKSETDRMREQREAIRALLREKKYDEAYQNWSREVRERAYVDLREPPS